MLKTYTVRDCVVKMRDQEKGGRKQIRQLRSRDAIVIDFMEMRFSH